MKRGIGIAFIIFLFANLSNAQQSVGFTDPNDIQTLLDYRLPDWGYSNFIMDFNASNNGLSNKFGELSTYDNSSMLSLAPAYTLYKESEERILDFTTTLSLDYAGSFRDFETQTGNIETDQDQFSSDISSIIQVKKYTTGNNFLYGFSNVELFYNSEKNENTQDGSVQNESISYDRILTFNSRLGYGFGRIRNVGPAIRAIRLSERLRAINRTALSDEDAFRAADQFTRFQGYQQHYDRPEKYFWRDLDRDISTDLGDLDAFDMLYLTDVLNEAIGSRLEGWEVIGGVQLNYLNLLDRNENRINNIINRNTTIQLDRGIFVTSRWYKNTSLEQQWGLFFNSELNFPMEEQDMLPFNAKRSLILNGGINWLRTITDRMLVQLILSDTYTRSKLEANEDLVGQVDDYASWQNQLALNASVSIFVENSLQLNFSARPILIHSGTTDNDNVINFRRFEWQLTAGLRYYFGRNLY